MRGNSRIIMTDDNHQDDIWNRNRKKQQGPPDLDEMFKNFFKKFSGGGADGDDNGNKSSREKSGMPFIAILLIFLFGYLGFFIVQPGEESAVLRFGKYVETVGPGPHWIIPFVQSRETVNVYKVMRTEVSGAMITKEVNIVHVSLAVQYKIGNLRQYLFEVKSPINSLVQATESAMRQVIANLTLDQSLSTNLAGKNNGNQSLGKKIESVLEKNLEQYKTGIEILGVEVLAVLPPETVKEAFNDAIKAQEDEVSYRNQAEAYASREVPLARGDAARIIAGARAYSEKVVLDAEGEISQFNAIAEQYKLNPEIMRTRMYITYLEDILGQVNKVVVDGKLSNNVMYLPLDKFITAHNADRTGGNK